MTSYIANFTLQKPLPHHKGPVFAQAFHYAIWLRLVPLGANERRGGSTFTRAFCPGSFGMVGWATRTLRTSIRQTRTRIDSGFMLSARTSGNSAATGGSR